MKAIWNNEVIAESNDTILLEGNQYFPPESIKKGFFIPNDRHSVCPHKGLASYYTVTVNGNENAHAAWYYPEPKSGYEQIKNYVAFWQGIRVE